MHVTCTTLQCCQMPDRTDGENNHHTPSAQDFHCLSLSGLYVEGGLSWGGDIIHIHLFIYLLIG